MTKLSLPKKPVQILDKDGKLTGKDPNLPPEQLRDWYRWMVLGRVFSDKMVAMQRQGRMGTFAPLNGQEAISVAMAAPLQPDDWLIGSYREALAYFVKGVDMIGMMQRWKGRIPETFTHEQRALPVQIVLATQMPHAVGVAMGIKYEGKPNIVVGVIGDGATSEGDFNESLNFAGVYQAPIVLVIQNNGWAISTSRSKQTAAEYLAHRGPGFGIPSYIVDGNDILACYKVMQDAADRARAGDGPTLIEAITYRLGAHTTADDPTKYRDTAELEYWKARDPIPRLRRYLLDKDYMSDNEDEQMHEDVVEEIEEVVAELEAQPPMDPLMVFDMTYVEPPEQLKRQRDAFAKRLNEKEGQHA